MGPAGEVTLKNTSSRKCCVPHASRVFAPARFEDRLPAQGSDKDGAKGKLVVADLETDGVVDEEEYEKMPGLRVVLFG